MNRIHVRPPAVAGMFYPADPGVLAHDLASMLRAVPPRLCFEPAQRHLKALIVPHAGYVYSGNVAASAFAQLVPLKARISRVVLLGPCHRVSVRGIALPAAEHFSTPLGEVPLDRAGMDAALALPQVVEHPAAHAQEHSLEVQVPFLQRALDRFTLVPLAVGNATVGEVAQVIETLWGGDETLIVVSTDLSHFHDYDEARRIDNETVHHVEHLESLTSYDQACGALPVNALIAVAKRHGLEVRLLDHCNSGDTAGDRSRVVGYASFALYAPTPRPPAVDPTPANHAALGAALLARARNAIAAPLHQGTHAEPWHPALGDRGACFVTLTQGGALRGCIGTLEAWRALDDDVRENARAAAFRDPRFAPLTAKEFERTRVEVSLLSPPEAFPVVDEADALARLQPGVDGVILTCGDRRSTFLPQVWEQLPQPVQFLAHLKQKAGLAEDFWSPEVRLQRYKVRKWQEPANA